jgi:hypothetical protein
MKRSRAEVIEAGFYVGHWEGRRPLGVTTATVILSEGMANAPMLREMTLPRHPERGGRVGVSVRISNYEKHGQYHVLRILRSLRRAPPFAASRSEAPPAQDDGGMSYAVSLD